VNVSTHTQAHMRIAYDLFGPRTCGRVRALHRTPIFFSPSSGWHSRHFSRIRVAPLAVAVEWRAVECAECSDVLPSTVQSASRPASCDVLPSTVQSASRPASCPVRGMATSADAQICNEIGSGKMKNSALRALDTNPVIRLLAKRGYVPKDAEYAQFQNVKKAKHEKHMKEVEEAQYPELLKKVKKYKKEVDCFDGCQALPRRVQKLHKEHMVDNPKSLRQAALKIFWNRSGCRGSGGPAGPQGAP
jgi:hypothetical protein